MIKLIEGQKTPKNKHSRLKLWFQCDCGNKKQIIWKNYSTNHTKSCGKCLQRTKFNVNIIKNKKYGFLKLDMGQDFPIEIKGKTRLWFQCDCGNKKQIVLQSVLDGLTKSCGKCKLMKSGTKWEKPIYYSKEYWLSQKLPLKLIDENLPDEWSGGSVKIMKFQCSCGNIFEDEFGRVFSNHRKTCSRCNYIKKEKYLNRKFGKLKLIDENLPDEFHKNISSKFWFQCDCGNRKQIRMRDVVSGNTASCGECNLRTKEWWESQKFGHLKVLEGKNISLFSEEYLKCKCSCGNVCHKQATSISRSHTISCGECYSIGLKWFKNLKPLTPTLIKYPTLEIYENCYKNKEWLENAYKNSSIKHITNAVGLFDGVIIYWLKKFQIKISSIKKHIRYPLAYLQEYFRGSFLEPLEDAQSTNHYSGFRCKLCGSMFQTKLTWIYHNKIVSCGCVYNQTSFASNEIAEFIESFGFKVQYGKDEYKIKNYRFDIFVKEKNLIIEYHGLRYHSDELGKSHDLLKYNVCVQNGHKYIAIFEDEWKQKKEIFKNLIKNVLGINIPKFKIRPQKCEIKQIKFKEIKHLYNKYHYIGGENLSAKYHIGVYYDQKLVAGMSIKRPTRQNSGDWEIARMVCSEYQIYGLWSYLMKWIFRNLVISGKLITFSDNRLMSGKVYEKMGFKQETQIRSDYYWVKKNKRFHKSGLRKTKEEKLTHKTEIELRAEQGYFRIWDCGKIKWSINL